MNLKEEKLSFFPIEERHRDIILDWFRKDHVQEFYYGQGLENTLKNLALFINGIENNGENSFKYWIAFIEDQPFGFLSNTFTNSMMTPTPAG